MPVTVHVPIRLRVTEQALSHDPGAIDAAVARALGRALARSRTEILAETGGYLGVSLGAPEIAWSGAGLAGIDSATRRVTERRLALLIGTATRVAGLDAQTRAEPPLGGRPAEPYDPARERSFGRYAVDSYQGGVDAITIRRPNSARHGDPQVPFVRTWEIATVGEDFDSAYVRQRIQDEASVLGVTLSPVYGIIVRSADGWTLIVSGDGFTGDKTYRQPFGKQTRRRPHRRGLELAYTDEEVVPPLTAASATEIPLPSDPADRVYLMHDLFAATIRTELRDLFDPSFEQDRHLLTPDELGALIEQETEAAVAILSRAGGTAAFLLRIDWGDVHFNVALPASIAALIGWDGVTPATILPSAAEVQRPGRMAIGTGVEGAFDLSKRAPHADAGGRFHGGSKFGTDGRGTGDGTARPIFPSLGLGPAMTCEPFLAAEPGLDKLPSDGPYLRRLVAEIAERLDMVPCGFPATFCVGAATTLAARAATVGAFADGSTTGELTLPPGSQGPGGRGGGNMGYASFRPVTSRGLQLLRRLSQAAARIAELRRAIRQCYMQGDGRTQLGDTYATNHVGWVLRFDEAVAPAMFEGVGEIFTQACQIIMLQLLETSMQQITARQRNLHVYAPLFRDVLVRRLSDIGTLTTMRDRLRIYEIAQTAQAPFGSGIGASSLTGAAATIMPWAAAAKAMADACVVTEGFSHLPGAAQEIVTDAGLAKIRDAHGFLWSRVALERAMVEQRGQAESIDPLVAQLSDIPGTVERFRSDPGSAETILADLLAEMVRLNAGKRQEAGADPLYGLQVGRIQEDTGPAGQVPGLPYVLGGVHLLAHEQLYPFFGGDTAYAEGLNHVFSVELGKQGLTHFAIFTGLVLLAVVCAPAAFVAGVAVAVHEVDKAQDRRDLYRALINPELVLNLAEIEMELYIAYVGLALSLLPEAGTALKAASLGLRGAARSGVAVGLRLAARSIARTVSRQVTEQLARELLPALIHEFAVNLFMEQVVIPKVIGPMIAAVERELALRTSVGGQAGADRLIDEIERAAALRSAHPLPAGTGASP